MTKTPPKDPNLIAHEQMCNDRHKALQGTLVEFNTKLGTTQGDINKLKTDVATQKVKMQNIDENMKAMKTYMQRVSWMVVLGGGGLLIYLLKQYVLGV